METLVYLVLLSVIGRALLAWFPAGEPGGHTPRDLPATWATSFALGLVIYVVQGHFCAAYVWRPDDDGDPSPVHFLPWIVLGAHRVLTLPAGLVPRHRPRLARPGIAGAMLLAASLATCITIAVMRDGSLQRDEVLFEVAGSCAVLLLVDHALAVGRRDALGRRALLVVLACSTWWSLDGELLSVLPWTLAMAAAVPWLRRADGRARVLAIVGFAGTLAFDSSRWPVSCAALLVLVLATAAPSRATTLGWVVAIVLVVAAAMRIEPGWPAWKPATGMPIVLVGLSLLAGIGLASRKVPISGDSSSTIDPPRREVAFLAAALACMGLLLLVPPASVELHGVHSSHRTAILPLHWLALLPSAFLLVGLACLPAEKTAASR